MDGDRTLILWNARWVLYRVNWRRSLLVESAKLDLVLSCALHSLFLWGGLFHNFMEFTLGNVKLNYKGVSLSGHKYECIFLNSPFSRAERLSRESLFISGSIHSSGLTLFAPPVWFPLGNRPLVSFSSP